MPGDSSIEWTEKTWNPVTGCFEVSPGCAHCYAKVFAERWRGIPGHPYEQGFDLRLWPERLEIPLRWRKPRMIFVNSMSDLFHEDVPAEFIARVFGTMAAASWHTFQVLTKRPQRMVELLNHPEFESVMRRASGELGHELPLPNVWLGVSIENRRFVGRADLLRQTPAAVRFISAEPLLGPLVAPNSPVTPGRASRYPQPGAGLDLNLIDWLIVGGESGPKHRPVREEWVRDLRDACSDIGVLFFLKQWGGVRPKSGGRGLDGRTHDAMPAPHRETTHASRSEL